MIIKICGITRPEDAQAAAAAGAAAIGFNFYPRSPRFIDPEAAGAIDTEGMARVGVFVNEPPRRIEEIARIARLDIAQLHGDETRDQYPARLAVWKAARVEQGFDLSAWQDCPAEALLLDGPAALLYGGAGIPFDWSIARAASRKIILAGGLDSSNVRSAVEQAHPWGVDACSRIESSPGIKDHQKMIAFIQAAKQAFQC